MIYGYEINTLEQEDKINNQNNYSSQNLKDMYMTSYFDNLNISVKVNLDKELTV